MKDAKMYTCNTVKWFDSVNGNTYHSCRITRHSDGDVLYCPMTYGYGEHYRQTAQESMVEAGWLPGYDSKTAYRSERENHYPIEWIVSESTKRKCVANGKA